MGTSCLWWRSAYRAPANETFYMFSLLFCYGLVCSRRIQRHCICSLTFCRTLSRNERPVRSGVEVLFSGNVGRGFGLFSAQFCAPFDVVKRLRRLASACKNEGHFSMFSRQLGSGRVVLLLHRSVLAAGLQVTVEGEIYLRKVVV